MSRLLSRRAAAPNTPISNTFPRWYPRSSAGPSFGMMSAPTSVPTQARTMGTPTATSTVAPGASNSKASAPLRISAKTVAPAVPIAPAPNLACRALPTVAARAIPTAPQKTTLPTSSPKLHRLIASDIAIA